MKDANDPIHCITTFLQTAQKWNDSYVRRQRNDFILKTFCFELFLSPGWESVWPIVPPVETFSALLAILAGNSPVTGEFPTQRPVTRSFDVFVDLRLNKRLSKQSWGWWFETPSRPLWRQCNDRLPPLLMIYIWPCVSLVKQIILPPISRTHNRKVTNWNAPILSVFQFIPHPHTNPTHHPYKNWCYFIIPSYCLVFIKPTRIPHCAKIGKRAWETSQVRSCVQEFRW